MKNRIVYLLKLYIPIILIGILYYFVCSITNFKIPCMFRVVTGYKCPGCGITHMFLYFFNGNFKLAFKSNPCIFVLLPILFIIFLKENIMYIKNGYFKSSKFEKLCIYLMIVILIGFCLIRNINYK